MNNDSSQQEVIIIEGSDDSNESEEESEEGSHESIDDLTFNLVRSVFDNVNFDFSSIQASPSIINKLRLYRQYADRAAHGHRLFLLIKKCPLCYCTLEIEEKEVEGAIVRSEHLSYVTENHLLPIPFGYIALVTVGYKWYTDFFNEQRSNVNNPNPFFTQKQWKKRFNMMTDIIDDVINENQGFKCYLNGNNEDNATFNVICLHFCDIISILLHRRKMDIEAGVSLCSMTLSRIQPMLVDQLSTQILNEKGINFVLDNANFFYMIYGYWENKSKLSVRLKLNSELNTVPHAKVLVSDDYFYIAQKGKLQQLRREINKEGERMLFCLI